MTTGNPQVRALLQSLQKEADLPAHIQAAISEISKQDSQAANKAMHSAVSKIGTAKKALQQAQDDRASLHGAWRSFLTEATARWDQYGKEFEEDDQKLQEKIAKAKEDLQSAKSQFDAIKMESGNAEATEEISSDMEEPPERSAKQISEGLAEMSTSLRRVKEKAEAMELEQARKRSRIAIGPFPHKADA